MPDQLLCVCSVSGSVHLENIIDIVYQELQGKVNGISKHYLLEMEH